MLSEGYGVHPPQADPLLKPGTCFQGQEREAGIASLQPGTWKGDFPPASQGVKQVLTGSMQGSSLRLPNYPSNPKPVEL